MSGTSSDEEVGDETLWEASKYRSRFFRTERDVNNTNALDLSILGPTKVKALPIIAKCPVKDEEFGKVVYLTVSEGMVDASKTQRRSGLHVEAVSGIGGVGGTFKAGKEGNWGGGVRDYFWFMSGDPEDGEPDAYDGGLYMASNMDDTCMLWDALIAKGQGIVDHHGGGEHLRPFIGKGTKLKANELAWLTDRTPHEALPQAKSGYRQFFRLVTSNISVWFKQHSTANPKVPVPDHVQIIEEDKFATGGQHQTTKKRQMDPSSSSPSSNKRR